MFPCSPQINKIPLFPNSKYLNAFQRSLFINFCCSPRALRPVPFKKSVSPCSAKSLVGPQESVTYHIFRLKVFPPVPVRASLES